MKSRTVIALSLLLAMLAGTRAWSEEPGTTAKLPFEAPGVLLSFEGGNVAGNLANVLDVLRKNKIEVHRKQRTLDDKATLCDLLKAEGFPPPCGSLLPAIQTLNPGTNLNKLRPGDVVNLPDIQIYDYTASGQFAANDPKQANRAQDILNNWTHLNPNRSPDPRLDGSRSITYQAFQIVVPTRDDAAVEALYEQLKPLGSSNLLVDRLVREARPARVFSNRPPTSVDQMSQACRDGRWNTVSYSDYTTGDPDAIDVVRASLPPTRATTPVWIIDGPLMPAPSLYPAFGMSPGPADWTWTCKWAPFSTALHHATHMASIIASQGEKFGFIGLAPNVTLRQTRWLEVDENGTSVKVPARFVYLQRQIVFNENGGGAPLRVYLMASAYDDDSTTPLAKPEQRFTGLLSRTIRDNHPLLIAAAGQADDTHPAVDLTNETPMSPMNLGDLENVVIVTACVNCERKTAQLMETANRSTGYHKMIHVAAPGGGPIGGWVSSDSIGAANGTSQAAAYAAGVAASMISAFPNVFTQAKLVKRRLQVTSWPLPAGDGTSPDPNSLAAGVVDPVLALLDPGKTWLKQAGGGWKAVAVKGVSLNKGALADQIPMTDAAQNTQWVRSDAMLRLMKTPSNQFSVYQDRNLLGHGEVAEIERVDGVAPPARAVLMMCDGNSVSLNQVEDFIPAMQGFADASCR